MRKSLLLLAVLAGLPCAPAAADDSPDSVDLVYLGESRPVRLRLHVTVEGKPPSVLLDGYLRELFAFFDRDGDGVLSRDEAGRVPKAEPLRTFLQPGTYLPITPNARARPEDLDADEDGKVTAEEFLGYYRRSGVAPLRVVAGPGRGAQVDVMTAALFHHLDTDRDGKLSKDELSRAPAILAALDQNEDELVTVQELTAGVNPAPAVPPVNSVAATRPGANGPGLPDNSPFFVISGDDVASRLAQRAKLARVLLDRYDQDRDQRLRRAEIVLEKGPFRQLDTNRDGDLDAMELVQFVTLPPEVELTLQLGKLGPKESAASLTDPARAAELAKTVRRSGDAVLAVSLEAAILDVRAADGPTAAASSPGPAFLRLFKAADAKGKGFLEMSDVEPQPYQFLKNLFAVADRDGDGRLTEKEVTAWVELQEKARQHLVTLTVTDDGRDLFRLFDVNRDGRLGLREARTMWSRLEAFDVAKTGSVARTAFPRQFNLTVGRGTTANVARTAPPSPNPPAGTPRVGRGPLWFRKMDRNRDGDVSPREWLGTPEQFSKLDTDGDGLISVEEAEAADNPR